MAVSSTYTCLFRACPRIITTEYKQFVYMPHIKLIIESLCKDSKCVKIFDICSHNLMLKTPIQTSVCKLLTSDPANIFSTIQAEHNLLNPSANLPSLPSDPLDSSAPPAPAAHPGGPDLTTLVSQATSDSVRRRPLTMFLLAFLLLLL